jgi:integrase
MASLYRPSRIHFVLLDEQGQHRHRTPDGGRITKSTPGAIRVKVKASKWRGQYRDASGRVIRVTLVASKEVSRRMLAELEVTARQAERGMVASYEAPHRRALVEHLADFEKDLLARGASPKHVAQTVRRVRAILDGCGFNLIRDLSVSRVQAFLAELRDEGMAPKLPPPPVDKKGRTGFTKRQLAEALRTKQTTIVAIVKRHGLAVDGEGRARRFSSATAEAIRDWLRRGRGPQTIAHYATAARQFGRWLTKDRRTPANLLDGLSVESPESDLRHDRRALTEDELRALIIAAKSSPQAFRGLTGPERAVLYATGCATGLRAGELACLTPESFELDCDPAYVVLGASQTKNGKTAQVPLAGGMADVLGDFLADRPAATAVWPGTWHERAAEMIRLDLATAGIPYTIPGPDGTLFADFHSLRHTTSAMLDRSGATLKTAMQIMRHSDPKLTAKRYGRAQLHDLAGAVEKMPNLVGPGPKPETMRATGTEGANPRRMGTAQAPRERRSPQLVGETEEEIVGQVSTEPKVEGSNPSGCNQLRRIFSPAMRVRVASPPTSDLRNDSSETGSLR